MGQDSKIEWTDHTINLWHGCTKVHEGCDNCYAETLAHRWGNDIWGNDKPRKMISSAFAELDKMQKVAALTGGMQRVFCGSMKDIFEKPMPLIDSKGNKAIDSSDGSPICTDFLREQLFDNITGGKYNNLMFLLLTKRPSNIKKYIPKSWHENPPTNIMYGTSPVNQETANKLIPQLLATNGKHFLSVEPQLGPVDISNFLNLPLSGCQIDWGDMPLITEDLKYVLETMESHVSGMKKEDEEYSCTITIRYMTRRQINALPDWE